MNSSRISSWRIAQPDIVPPSVRGPYVRVQHRHIIYVQGYDPRGLAQYYRMFRTELRKFGRLYQLTATISRPQGRTRRRDRVLDHRDQGRRLADPHRPTISCASKISSSATSLRRSGARCSMPVWIYWRLVFAGTIARFGKRELAFRDLHHLAAFRAAARSGRAPEQSPLCSGRAWTRSAFPHLSALRRRPRFSLRCSAPC